MQTDTKRFTRTKKKGKRKTEKRIHSDASSFSGCLLRSSLGSIFGSRLLGDGLLGGLLVSSRFAGLGALLQSDARPIQTQFAPTFLTVHFDFLANALSLGSGRRHLLRTKEGRK